MACVGDMHVLANQLDTTVMGHPLNAISILLTEIARAVQPIAESVCIFVTVNATLQILHSSQSTQLVAMLMVHVFNMLVA